MGSKAHATVIAGRNSPVDTWIPSRYNFHAILGSGARVVSNLFTGETETIDGQTWDTYLAPGAQYRVPASDVAGLAQELFDQGFLVSQSIDELERIRVYFQEVRYSTTHLRVLIAPTLACNLRCAYCFERGVWGSPAMRRMSSATADAACAFVAEAAAEKEEVFINWFGGEPLMRMDTIGRISERLLRALEDLQVRCVGQVTTNGVLLTRQIVRDLCAWKVTQCQLTVDVPGANKLDVRGRPVLNRQLDRAAEAAAHLRIKLRVNVAAESEDEFDGLYNALRARGLHQTLDRIHLAPILPTECGGDGCAPLSRDKPRAYDVLRRERAKLRSMGFPLAEPVPTGSKPCGATCVDQHLIDPQGFLYKCLNDLGITDRAYASVLPGSPVRPINLLPWLTYDWFAHEECRACPLLPRCAGGCPHRRMRQYGGDCCLYHVREWEEWPDVLRVRAAAHRP